jgi:transposase
MLPPEKRKAIHLLHEEGMGIRQLCRHLRVSRNTVRAIIAQKGRMPDAIRKDKIRIDEQLLRRLYQDCNGWVQRIHEKLTEEEGNRIGYSTLTRMLRDLDLSHPNGDRCDQVADVPGKEMQHDTSPYQVAMGDKRIWVVGSMLYYRYSKIRYLKFYRSFDRFKMKCFFHEALTFWGYSARVCIIDNTNLARLRGTGKSAVIVPEMERFTKQYGFEFVCHEKGHANRKAGNERSFWTVETNFFPGRRFESLEDLNRQALDWATVRMANRPVSKSKLIPARAFDHEQVSLVKLPRFVSPPYRDHKRTIDQYGYISFDGNFYWVPSPPRGELTVLEYGSRLNLYHKRRLVAEYALPAAGVKNQQFWPAGHLQPPQKPKHRKQPTAHEERKLRAAAKEVDAYLNFLLKPKGKEKHRAVRELYGLYQKTALSLFIKTIKRALTYRITDITTVERIATLLMHQGEYELPGVEIDEQFQDRPTYREGRFSEGADLSIYEKLLEDGEENG